MDESKRPVDLLAILRVNDESEGCKELYATDKTTLGRILGEEFENLANRLNKTRIANKKWGETDPIYSGQWKMRITASKPSSSLSDVDRDILEMRVSISGCF